MPSAEELANMLCSTILTYTHAPTRHQLTKLALDNVVIKKFKPEFVSYINTLLDPRESLSYITIDFIITATLVHFHFI